MGYKKYKKGIYIGFLILIGVIIFLVVRKQKEDKKEHIVTEQLLETQEEHKETNVIEENQSNNESGNQNKEVIQGTERAIEVKTYIVIKALMCHAAFQTIHFPKMFQDRIKIPIFRQKSRRFSPCST